MDRSKDNQVVAYLQCACIAWEETTECYIVLSFHAERTTRGPQLKVDNFRCVWEKKPSICTIRTSYNKKW